VTLTFVAGGALVTTAWSITAGGSPWAYFGLAIPVVTAALPLFIARTWARLLPLLVLTPLVAVGTLQFTPGWLVALIALIRLDRRSPGTGPGARIDRFLALAAVLVLAVMIAAPVLLAVKRRLEGVDAGPWYNAG
jgi:hypothetical protein